MLGTTPVPPDDDYERFSAGLRARFVALVANGAPLFTTSAEGLFDAFLSALPADDRQQYACHACRRFVDRYGGLVTLGADGRAQPVMWDTSAAPGIFAPAVAALARLVVRAEVTGVFLTSKTTWGTPVTGAWHHMAVTPPPPLVYHPSPVKTASQASAEKREDYGTLCRGLADFPAALVEQAHAALVNGALYRSEKCIGVARWLLDLHTVRASVKGAARDNVTWLAVATAPAGFAHVRSTMIGTLLEDLASGKDFASIQRAFDAKMSPLRYQRPTAPPSAGNIAQAEKVVAALQSAGALDRRFARIEDVRPLWTPRTPTGADVPAGGVFGHLKARAAPAPPALDLPPVTMTWEKFARTVLPEAQAIECFAPSTRGTYYALITAANPEAPPLLQWDAEDARNPVSWYTYPSGSDASQWNLRPGAYAKVTAVSLFPHQWGGKFAHQGDGVLFILDGARDTGHERGAGFFPEQLRAEYHGVRATMEAFARQATIAGRDEASACGLGLRKGQSWDVRLRVTPRSGPVSICHLDRWD